MDSRIREEIAECVRSLENDLDTLTANVSKDAVHSQDAYLMLDKIDALLTAEPESSITSDRCDVAASTIRGFLSICENVFGAAVEPSREALKVLISNLTSAEPDTCEDAKKIATDIRCMSRWDAEKGAALIEAYASQVADKRVEEAQAVHEAIASICFEAGVETPDGTSVGAVRNLVLHLQEMQAHIERLREALKSIDKMAYSHRGTIRDMQCCAREALAATEPKP